MNQRQVMLALKRPFEPRYISWRCGATNKDKNKGIALAYIDARDVMRRLDDVFGMWWQCRYTPTIEPKPPVDRVREDYDPPEPLTRRELVKFWAVAMAPGTALLGVVGFAIWVRFGHVW